MQCWAQLSDNGRCCSQSVDQTEVGRIFSCLALVSALVQFVSGPMYAVIYNQTLDTFPGTFMLTTSLIIFVAMVITVLVKCLMAKGQLMKYWYPP